MFSKKREVLSKRWKKWKRKAPKVPGNTCPQIDEVLHRLDQFQKGDKRFTEFQHDSLMKKMEKLREANEQLRNGGHYWYQLCKEHLKDKE